jgi:hypothetical protein
MNIDLRMAIISHGILISKVFTEHASRFLEAHRPQDERPEPLIVQSFSHPGDTSTKVYVEYDRRKIAPLMEAALYYAMALSYVDPRIRELGENTAISFHPVMFGQAIKA